MIPPIIYVEGVPSDLVKLGPDVRGKVYVFTEGQWVLSDNECSIPEGWIAAPPPPKTTDNQ